MRHFPDELVLPNTPSCRSQKVGIIKCKSRADRSKPVRLLVRPNKARFEGLTVKTGENCPNYRDFCSENTAQDPSEPQDLKRVYEAPFELGLLCPHPVAEGFGPDSTTLPAVKSCTNMYPGLPQAVSSRIVRFQGEPRSDRSRPAAARASF